MQGTANMTTQPAARDEREAVTMVRTERPPMTHELKCWESYFHALVDNTKHFELRKFDREFRIGDELWLRETKYGSGEYTGRECRRRISYLMAHEDDLGLMIGYAILSLEPEGFRRSAPQDATENDQETLAAALKSMMETSHSDSFYAWIAKELWGRGFRRFPPQYPTATDEQIAVGIAAITDFVSQNCSVGSYISGENIPRALRAAYIAMTGLAPQGANPVDNAKPFRPDEIAGVSGYLCGDIKWAHLTHASWYWVNLRRALATIKALSAPTPPRSAPEGVDERIYKLFNALSSLAVNHHFKISADGPDIPNGFSCELCGVESQAGETLTHLHKCVLRTCDPGTIAPTPAEPATVAGAPTRAELAQGRGALAEGDDVDADGIARRIRAYAEGVIAGKSMQATSPAPASQDAVEMARALISKLVLFGGMGIARERVAECEAVAAATITTVADRARRDEREACAKVVENMQINVDRADSPGAAATTEIAAAIRARKP